MQAAEVKDVQVFADDTDIAVLLLHHWHEGLHDIFLTSKRSGKTWSIKDCCASLPVGMKKVILVLHRF